VDDVSKQAEKARGVTLARKEDLHIMGEFWGTTMAELQGEIWRGRKIGNLNTRMEENLALQRPRKHSLQD